MMRNILLLTIALLVPAHGRAGEAPKRSLKKDQPLPYIAVPCTADKTFTTGIEGPACDRRALLYAVNCEREGTIGRVRADGQVSQFVTLPAGQLGSPQV